MQYKAEWGTSSLEEEQGRVPLYLQKATKAKVTLRKFFAHYNTRDLGTGHAHS